MVEKVTIWSYLEPFLYSQEYLHLAEISKKLNKSHSVVRKYLNFLEKQGVLNKTIKGRLTLYKINSNHQNIIDYIILAEKEKIIKKCEKNLLLKEFVTFLNKNLNENNKALIFGSITRDIKKANDIDLLITGEIDLEDKEKEFERKFNIKVHLINVKDLKSITEHLKIEIMKKHLIVQGSEEIIKWLI